MTAQILPLHTGLPSNFGKSLDSAAASASRPAKHDAIMEKAPPALPPPPPPSQPSQARHHLQHHHHQPQSHPQPQPSSSSSSSSSGPGPLPSPMQSHHHLNHTPTSPTDDSRGRRRTRDSDGADGIDGGSGAGGEHGGDMDGQDVPGTSRKRRRSRKGLDKKFECPHEGCGKSYSRAEHLYRHQLNHNPKQIYHCDFPECHRSFVRQDLCARHKERHTARGSQLLRKDTFMHNINPIVTAAMAPKNGNMGKGDNKPFIMQSPASTVPSSARPGSDMSPSLDATMQSPASDSTTAGLRGPGLLNRQTSDPNYHSDANRPYGISTPQSQTPSGFDGPPRPGGFSAMNTPRSQVSPLNNGSNDNSFGRPPLQTHAGSMSSYNSGSPYTPASAQPPGYGTPTQMNNGNFPSQSPANYHSQQGFPNFTALPPPGFSTMSSTSQRDQQDSGFQGGSSGAASMSTMDRSTPATNAPDGNILDNIPSSYAIPVFGGEGYSRSPFAMADDFAAWLFNDSQFGSNASPMAYPSSNNMQGVLGSSATIGLQAPYFNYDPVVSGYYSQPAPPAHPMAVNSILDSNPESALSEEKRQQLLDLIVGRFTETDHAPVRKMKDEIMEGNKDDDHHVLSLRMMQTYIGSYWHHFHPQLPILHRPTFSAANCPNLLLLAIMALGASCLEKNHGFELTQACSELSNFLAWHLRWEIFMDAAFRPPAKLWIFQALLLLEIFEKMYATRPLHERAHIHHATTLTLMRRGSSLIGRSALDSPPSVKDNKHGVNGSSSGPNTPDEWWNHWITNEATRRVAFAAFLMDSLHATMFGHSAVMVAHEMRLPLPCDDALWSATSSAEVGRVEASLHANGIKPTTFLEGLKRTLNGQSVRTNSFGRAILMAGLLSVSWHMNQRDLQVSSLGVTHALGGRDKWRGSLTRAFDFWKQDFDQSISSKSEEQSNGSSHHYGNSVSPDNDFESRTVLHHLAHMAQHVDIVDCQIYAGANRLLGRSITLQDYNGAQRRMKEGWAPTARARDATFYAFRFLSLVLLPQDHGLPIPKGSNLPGFPYSARDDFLINRPWVLYFATLIVWSYGYALDGPLPAPYAVGSHDQRVEDMQGFLRRVGAATTPDDLNRFTNRNACLGLLMLMRDMFKKTRWELLHEASTLLSKCIEMLAPNHDFGP